MGQNHVNNRLIFDTAVRRIADDLSFTNATSVLVNSNRTLSSKNFHS
jgi:hypothetical protein